MLHSLLSLGADEVDGAAHTIEDFSVTISLPLDLHVLGLLELDRPGGVVAAPFSAVQPAHSCF